MVPLLAGQWHSLLEPPSPLTEWQRRIFRIALAVVTATRLYAIAPSLWDWDEAQFASGVREFNVGRDHHPHPPGFPLYMLAAKLVRPFVSSDFGYEGPPPRACGFGHGSLIVSYRQRIVPVRESSA